MKTINIPKGYEVNSINQEEGTITLKEIKKDITERIKDLNDAIEILGENDEEVKALYSLSNVLNLPKHMLAYQKLVVIIKALNEGWVADWENMAQKKYLPYFQKVENVLVFDEVDYSNSYNSNPLVLKEERLAKYVGTQFLHIYNQWLIK